MTVQFQTVANTRQMVPGKKVKKKIKTLSKKIYSEPICEVKRPLSFYCLFIAHRSILWLSTGNPWKFSNLDVESNNIQRVFLVCFSPHLCVGFLFLVLHSRALPPLPPPPPPALPPPRTTCPQTTYSYTTSIHTHTTYSHPTCPHITCSNQPCPHITWSHPIYPHTHNLWTHTHTTYSHPTCPHITCSNQPCPHITWSHPIYPHTHTTCEHTHTQLVHIQVFT